jgi:hypothetical protein
MDFFVPQKIMSIILLAFKVFNRQGNWQMLTLAPECLAMQPTLFLGLLPPPAARAWVFARRDGTGAGLAANAHKTLAVQGIVGHLMGSQIISHLRIGPA